MNNALSSVIVIPLTRSKKDWPTRVDISVKGESGQACIEHIRSISKERFLEKINSVTKLEMASIRKHLLAVFAESTLTIKKTR